MQVNFRLDAHEMRCLEAIRGPEHFRPAGWKERKTLGWYARELMTGRLERGGHTFLRDCKQKHGAR
jgi:hypothetical protein